MENNSESNVDFAKINTENDFKSVFSKYSNKYINLIQKCNNISKARHEIMEKMKKINNINTQYKTMKSEESFKNNGSNSNVYECEFIQINTNDNLQDIFSKYNEKYIIMTEESSNIDTD